MLQCPYCAATNAEDAPLCVNCGKLITEYVPAPYSSETEKLSKKHTSSLTATFVLDDDLITLIFQQYVQQMVITDKLYIGRGIPKDMQLPVLDLSAVAFMGGISRIHALIVPFLPGKYQVMDMGSTNGTYIDGRRLAPYKMYYLADSCQLTLGRLTLHIQYGAAAEGDNAFVSNLAT